jgi:hypothetical protein
VLVVVVVVVGLWSLDQGAFVDPLRRLLCELFIGTEQTFLLEDLRGKGGKRRDGRTNERMDRSMRQTDWTRRAEVFVDEVNGVEGV